MQTNFHNELTRVIQFECTHRRSYETKNNPLLKTTSFEKEQSIAYITFLNHSYKAILFFFNHY